MSTSAERETGSHSGPTSSEDGKPWYWGIRAGKHNDAFEDLKKVRPWMSCHHDPAKRYLICEWVEKCGVCGELRFTEERGVQPTTYWPATTRAQNESPEQWARRQLAASRFSRLEEK